MTAKEFAKHMTIHYRTALKWLDAGSVPGAKMQQSPIGNYWEIPTTALKMRRPKPGPKPALKSAQARGGKNHA